jgi:hypothetical protein
MQTGPMHSTGILVDRRTCFCGEVFVLRQQQQQRPSSSTMLQEEDVIRWRLPEELSTQQPCAGRIACESTVSSR